MLPSRSSIHHSVLPRLEGVPYHLRPVRVFLPNDPDCRYVSACSAGLTIRRDRSADIHEGIAPRLRGAQGTSIGARFDPHSHHPPSERRNRPHQPRSSLKERWQFHL